MSDRTKVAAGGVSADYGMPWQQRFTCNASSADASGGTAKMLRSFPIPRQRIPTPETERQGWGNEYKRGWVEALPTGQAG